MQPTDNLINLENYSDLLRATCFNKGCKDYQISYNQTKILIKKPAIDAEGLFWGSSIQASAAQGNLFITSAWISEAFQLIVMYQKDASSPFYPLIESSPAWAWQLASNSWQALTAHVGIPTESNPHEVLASRDLQVFNRQFAPYEAPSDLQALYLFERKWPTQAYAQGFSFYNFNKAGLRSFHQDPLFLNAFIEFGSASADGSFYAYWLTEQNIEDCPIVVFGEEGGIHPVALNTKELIALLTYDAEISSDDLGAYFYKEETYTGSSEARVAFLNWANTKFNIEQLYTEAQTTKILENAKSRYAEALYSFLALFDLTPKLALAQRYSLSGS